MKKKIYKNTKKYKKKRKSTRKRKQKAGAEIPYSQVESQKINPVRLSMIIKTNIPNYANIGPFKNRYVIQNFMGNDEIYFTKEVDLDNQIIDNSDLDALRTSFTSPEKLANVLEPLNMYKNIEEQLTKTQIENLIQNNIAFLIRTFLPRNSTFLLDNQPHTIFASQWDGNWSIKKKSNLPLVPIEDKYDKYQISVFLHLIPGSTISVYDNMKAFCSMRKKRISDNIREGTNQITPNLKIEKDKLKDTAKQTMSQKERLMDQLVNIELQKRVKDNK